VSISPRDVVFPPLSILISHHWPNKRYPRFSSLKIPTRHSYSLRRCGAPLIDMPRRTSGNTSTQSLSRTRMPRGQRFVDSSVSPRRSNRRIVLRPRDDAAEVTPITERPPRRQPIPCSVYTEQESGSDNESFESAFFHFIFG
jgi:hypothetical protein